MFGAAHHAERAEPSFEERLQLAEAGTRSGTARQAQYREDQRLLHDRVEVLAHLHDQLDLPLAFGARAGGAVRLGVIALVDLRARARDALVRLCEREVQPLRQQVERERVGHGFQHRHGQPATQRGQHALEVARAPADVVLAIEVGEEELRGRRMSRIPAQVGEAGAEPCGLPTAQLDQPRQRIARVHLGIARGAQRLEVIDDPLRGVDAGCGFAGTSCHVA